MDWSAKVLGAHIADRFQKRTREVILKIGRDGFDRVTLARVECFNFTAAATLSAILNSELQVTDTRDVYERIHPKQLVLPRIGAVAFAVLGAAFEAKGLGGATPLASWYRKHIKAADRVTFAALKSRDAHEHAAERHALVERTARRRSKAHRIRVDRHLARHPGVTPS